MAIGNTGQNLDFSGASATTIATSATVTVSAGSWVVAWVYYFAASTTVAVSDGTNSLTAIPAGSPVNDGNSRLATLARYYATGGTFTFTATYGASVPFRSIVVAEVTGRTSTALVAAQCAGQAQATPTTGTDAVSTGNATPQSTASEQVAYTMNDTSSGVAAAGTGFTSAGTFLNDTGDIARIETRARTSTTPVAATFTAAANVAHLSSQIIFDEDTGPPPIYAVAWIAA